MGFLKSGWLIPILLAMSLSLTAFGKKEDTVREVTLTGAAEIPATEPPKEVIAGGYQEIALDSEYALKASEEARKAWEGSAPEWKSALILTAESQIVAGRKIRLNIEGLPGIRGAVVFFPLEDTSPVVVTWMAK